MQYNRLGITGLEVSRICLGCMSFGDPARGNHTWTLAEEESRSVIKKALDKGINFFDTANVYSDGSSEEIVGQALNDFARREDVIIATKVHSRMRPGPNGGGLSRKAIMGEVEASLMRLKTDYIDLYQIHRFDHNTSLEETMTALHDLVRAGKVRYIGASSMYAWQFAKAQFVARSNGLTAFVSMQNYLNLLYREEEREMLPLCLDQGVGVIPWSPLARGRLTRDWEASTSRSESDQFGKSLYDKTAEADKKVIESVAAVAAETGISRAQIALAWVLQKQIVSAPIVGVTKLAQLADAVAAVDIKLSEDQILKLEENYVPHPVLGFN